MQVLATPLLAAPLSAGLVLAALAAGPARAQEAVPSVLASEADCETASRLEQTFANGARWELCFESRTRENLVLEHVTYTPANGEPFAVLASASLAQLHVAYDDNDVTYNDVTQYGLGGGYLIELTPEDCPDGSLIDIRTRPGICRTLRQTGDGYRSNSRATEREALELFSVSQVGAYAYVQNWTFHDDGAIEPAIGATGVLQRSSAETSLPFGRVLDNDLDTLWLSHTHNYHWRLDFDLGALADDDVVTESRHPPGADGRRVRETMRFEQETARRIDAGSLQAWNIWEREPDDTTRLARGYVIEPEHHGHRFERTDVEPHTAFDLFVTVARDCERFASQNARFNPDCLDHVLQYADAEPLVDADLVLWHRVGFHHVPRNEDQRHMHSHWDGFVIQPVNVSRANPATGSGDGNTLPVLGALPDQRTVTGEDVEGQLTASDADGDALAFGADNLPPGIRLAADGMLSGRPTSAGDYRVRVGVDDGRDVVSGEFVWRVAPASGDAIADRKKKTGFGSVSSALLAGIALALTVRVRRRRRGAVIPRMADR